MEMAVIVQFVVKPNEGADLTALTELAKESASIWRKHGGKTNYFAVAVGEVGNRVMQVTFESMAAYGTAVDAMRTDTAFQAWQQKRAKSGQGTFVRSNLAVEIAL